MDLAEALSFTTSEQLLLSSTSTSTTNTCIKNRAGLVLSCSTPFATFHYSPSANLLQLYDATCTEGTNCRLRSSIEIRNVIHIACSSDGRMLLAIQGDGGISCIDVMSQST
eukprot:840411_1